MNSIMRCLSVVITIVVSTANGQEHGETTTTRTTTPSSSSSSSYCGLYMAVSSTTAADQTSWGLYAGRDYNVGEHIGYSDVAINLLNFKVNSITSMRKKNKAEEEEEEEEGERQYLTRIVEFIESVVWVPGPAGASFELDKGRVISSIPGAGALGAFNPKLTNAGWDGLSSYARPLLGEKPGVNHPGRGAYSSFYNVQIQSSAPIKEGSEIFMDYGSSWEEEEQEDALEAEDYKKLDETVDKMIEFFKRHEEGLDPESKMEVYHFLMKDVMQAAVGEGKAKKIAGILPPSPDQLQRVMDVGGSLVFSEPHVNRPIEWLQQHGRCMDNIRPGASTLPDAGRGAFATRRISVGDVVAPVPLFHIPDKVVFDMYDLIATEGDEFIRSSDDVIGQQLLLNYCFCHPESSMVFLPGGAVSSFINHNNEPNAKIVWSSHQNHQKYWFDIDPEELGDDEYAYVGLMLEVVALNDIEEGEEVFIDYQPEWKTAWDKHKAAWDVKHQNGEVPMEWPLSAVELNDQHQTRPFKTQSEQELDPYPDTVTLKVFASILYTDNEGTADDPSVWGGERRSSIFVTDSLRDCTILSHEEVVVDQTDDVASSTSYNYTVAWMNDHEDRLYVKDVPHHALVFVNKAKTTDQFIVQDPFRHCVGIPDDIFPQGPWRNLAP